MFDMNNEQILTKAIEKAIANGWLPDENWRGYVRNMSGKYGLLRLRGEQYGTLDDYYSIESLIFSHDFAKALWGENVIGSKIDKSFTLTSGPDGWSNEGTDEESLSYELHGPKWQILLMEMVIAEDPIKYLGDYLK